MAFTESGFLHIETPLVGILYSRLDQVFKGASEAVNPRLEQQAMLGMFPPPESLFFKILSLAKSEADGLLFLEGFIA